MNHLDLLVKNILAHPHEFDWSTQGLGMLRVYLAPDVRLHVWDRALLVPGASPLHTHPWNFTSTIVKGRMVNTRFEEVTPGTNGYAEEWNRVKILCGENAHTVDDPAKVMLLRKAAETYDEGKTYSQMSEEIHWSLPEDGTVTICTRVFRNDRDHAYVFWRGKGGWVDAKPRKATREEVDNVLGRALETWF